MRVFALLVFLLVCTDGFSETVQKWTDDSGQVHYGDRPPSGTAKNIELLQIIDTFDPASYERALIRNSALEAEVKQIEAREKAEIKKAEKRLDDYFKELDRKDKELERTKTSKRKSRESERNKSSIKLKRSKQSIPGQKAQPSFRGSY